MGNSASSSDLMMAGAWKPKNHKSVAKFNGKYRLDKCGSVDDFAARILLAIIQRFAKLSGKKSVNPFALENLGSDN